MIDKITGTTKVSSLETLNNIDSILSEYSYDIFLPAVKYQLNYKSCKISIKSIVKYLQNYANTLSNVTVSQLRGLINNGNLIPGVKYCIENYVSVTYINMCRCSENKSFRPKNIDFPNTSLYHTITPVITAITPTKLNNIGYLLEYPDIEIGFKFFESGTPDASDSYYTLDKFPAEAFNYGIITFMEDKSRNIKCNFDIINGMFATGGKGNCYYPNFKANNYTYANVEISKPQKFFPVQRVIDDGDPQESDQLNASGDWGGWYHEFHTKGLDTFINTFLNSDEFEALGTTIIDTRRSILGNSSNQLSRINRLPAETFGTGNTAHTKYYIYRYYDAFFDNETGAPRSKSLNVNIDRSPLVANTTTSLMEMNLSNIPCILFGQNQVGEIVGSVLSVTSTTPSDGKSPRNVSIQSSDFVHIDKCYKGTIKIDHCIGIDITLTNGDNSLSYCFYDRFSTVNNSRIYDLHYSTIKNIESCNISTCVNLRLFSIDSSTIRESSDILQYYGKRICNSNIDKVFNPTNVDYTLEPSNELTQLNPEDKFPRCASSFSDLIGCSIEDIIGFNNNGYYMPLFSSFSLIDCRIRGFNHFLFAVCSDAENIIDNYLNPDITNTIKVDASTSSLTIEGCTNDIAIPANSIAVMGLDLVSNRGSMWLAFPLSRINYQIGYRIANPYMIKVIEIKPNTVIYDVLGDDAVDSHFDNSGSDFSLGTGACIGFI